MRSVGIDLGSNLGINPGIPLDVPQYTARLARDDATRHDAYALRYLCYLDGGFIAPNKQHLFSDRFDGLANTETVVVYQGQEPIASVRVCFLSLSSHSPAPARDPFPDEVEALLAPCRRGDRGMEAVETTRLVTSPRFANDQGLVFMLYRLAGLLGIQRDVRILLSCVRHNHVPFYRRLRYQEVAGPKLYPGLTCPMHLLACSRGDYDAVRGRFPLMDPDAFPDDDVSGFLAGQSMATQIRPSPALLSPALLCQAA